MKARTNIGETMYPRTVQAFMWECYRFICLAPCSELWEEGQKAIEANKEDEEKMKNSDGGLERDATIIRFIGANLKICNIEHYRIDEHRIIGDR